MSHARLKTKAAGYAAYAAEAAWTERHPFCPCLLFLTTTETRALAFLKTLNGQLDKHGRANYYSRRGGGYFDWFAAAACAHAREPERAFAERCWDDLVLAGGGLTLGDCLNKARVAYDATRAKEEAEERAREAERKRLTASPEARRAHLQQNRLRFHGEHFAQFGEPGATALRLLLASTDRMTDVERDAFAALVRQLDDDPLEAQPVPEPVPPTWTDTQAVALLVDQYRRQQRALLHELAARYGDGPALRLHRRDLDEGGLLGPSSRETLEMSARHDQEARARQERLRLAYLDRRDREARQRRHQAGLAARLAHGHSAVYPLVDRDRLRICRRCEEIAYPDHPDRVGAGLYHDQTVASRCHFCAGSDLAAWDAAYQVQLEYGAADRDLTFGGIGGSMHEHGFDEEEGYRR